MLLIDFSQVFVSNIMMHISLNGAPDIDKNTVREMILNSLRRYRVKFHRNYGELVLCCDDRVSWRKGIFPFYKAGRRTAREKSNVNWKLVFSCLEEIKVELIENLPYKVLQVETAEADDIIASLCHQFGQNSVIPRGEPIMIISGDKDFGQLQKYWNVQQYDPVHNKPIIINNPEMFILEHIMRGDRADGIPNFLSDDNTFVKPGARQTKMMTTNIEQWLNDGTAANGFIEDSILRFGFLRNDMLINLDNIPEKIQKTIIEMYKNIVPSKRSKLLNYFMKHRLSNHLSAINEF